MNGKIETTTEYVATEDQEETLKNWRHLHAHGDQTARYIRLNQATRSVARLFITLCPDSKDLDAAIERLEEARHWACRAISKNEVCEDGQENR